MEGPPRTEHLEAEAGASGEKGGGALAEDERTTPALMIKMSRLRARTATSVLLALARRARWQLASAVFCSAASARLATGFGCEAGIAPRNVKESPAMAKQTAEADR